MPRAFFFIISLFLSSNAVFALTQTKPVIINNELIKKIKQLKPDTSNAYELEKLLGPAAACLPLDRQSTEIWSCQWKGALNSNRLPNTLTIFFESGMITDLQALGNNGKEIK